MPSIRILLLAEDNDRVAALRSQLAMVLPQASVVTTDASVLDEAEIHSVDVALIDAGPTTRVATDSLRLLRARGFSGPIVVVLASSDDPALCNAMQAFCATHIPRAKADAVPLELGTAVTAALGTESTISAELAQARRVFAAGQVALSLQHAINNPLAALLAEAQLLQLEENLTAEQRASADRMVELCRRVVSLVRRLDALGNSERDGAHAPASQ